MLVELCCPGFDAGVDFGAEAAYAVFGDEVGIVGDPDGPVESVVVHE